jgi:hypothetical protein
MRLKLDDLQKVVKKTLDEERAVEALKQEIKRVLGPSVLTEGKLEEVAANANAWIDVLERTGRSGRMDFLTQVTAGFLDHRHPEVRKFAARVVPEKFLGRLANDSDVGVRHIVATRVPLATVREMMKKFKNDDQLRTIYRQRKLHEAGVAQPKVEPMGHDPVDGAEAMGSASKTPKGPELSESWYAQQAWNLLHDYGRNIEYAWEELAVRRFCSSVKATSLVEVDEVKLLKAVKDLIKEREDMAMERNALRETLDWLEKQAEEQDRLDETMIPELKEVDDSVRNLVESGATPEQYIERAMALFRIQESQLPAAIRKYRLGEGNRTIAKVPMIGWLPHGGSFRAIDERALDIFCEHWNRRQQMAGEPIKIRWSTHPVDLSKVGFSVSLS